MYYFVCLIFIARASIGSSETLPSFITPCHKDQSPESFNACILEQARNALPYFAKGIPELGMGSLDPITIDDLEVTTGSLKLKQRNLIVRGLKSMEIKELRWDLQKNTGYIKTFGNLTVTCDYETQGRVLVIPVAGTGKMTVKMINTEITMKYKLKKVVGADGRHHLASYDLKAKQNYEKVKFRLDSDLGDNVLTTTINQVLNDNWAELMREVGPPHTKAVSSRVSAIINIFYSKVLYDDILPS